MANFNFTEITDLIELLIVNNKCRSPLDLMPIAFPELSNTEQETLFYFSHGLHVSDTAKFLGKAESTSQSHIKACKSKLSISSNTDLRLLFHSRMLTIKMAWDFSIPSRVKS